MFNAISGTIAGKRFDTLFIEQGGLEWEISVPAICIDDFGRLGDRTRVLTWLQHTEVQMRLYGFPDEATRLFFLELIKVDGIGPRQAMKILSGIPVSELSAALEKDDLEGIERAPGVGKKTAQKILLALKGKVVNPGVETLEPGSEGELVRALSDMGYDPKKAQEVVSRIAKEIDSGKEKLAREDREKELFKRAILCLSGER
jgi:Holliday junction DNA helicase RuvA